MQATAATSDKKTQEDRETQLGKNFYPANIFLMDKRFSHHVIVVEKSTHTLFLYQNQNGIPKLVKNYKIATGAITGNKRAQGDRKTPEGIYHFQKFYPAKQILEMYGEEVGVIYGAGAFTTDYPNLIDVRNGKTGGGIWLHSTDDDSRVNKGLDSRGCVVAVDTDLKDISRYIDLQNTPVIIVQNLEFLKKETWETNRKELLNFVEGWADAWKEKRFDDYIASYSKTNFHDYIRGNYSQFKEYKKAIFSRTESPQIDFSNISVLAHDNYVIITLEQDYSSKLVQDIGKKTLYLQKDEDYQWKIVAELWSHLEPATQELAFTPSMRFFPETSKQQLVKASSGERDDAKENE